MLLSSLCLLSALWCNRPRTRGRGRERRRLLDVTAGLASRYSSESRGLYFLGTMIAWPHLAHRIDSSGEENVNSNAVAAHCQF